jgi:hypothetical protein
MLPSAGGGAVRRGTRTDRGWRPRADGEHVNHDPIERQFQRAAESLRRALRRYEECVAPGAECKAESGECDTLMAQASALAEDVAALLLAWRARDQEREKDRLTRRARLN